MSRDDPSCRFASLLYPDHLTTLALNLGLITGLILLVEALIIRQKDQVLLNLAILSIQYPLD